MVHIEEGIEKGLQIGFMTFYVQPIMMWFVLAKWRFVNAYASLSASQPGGELPREGRARQ